MSCFPLLISYIQELGIHIFFLSTILKNSWPHLYSDWTTGQKSWWNGGPYVQVGIYTNRLVREGSNQRYKISNATKSAVFAATDSGPGNEAKTSVRPSVPISARLKQTNKKKARQFLKKWRKTGQRLTWISTCWLSTTLLLTSVCQKMKRVHKVASELKHICIL